MKLNDFEEEIYKCSGCGLCQGVCPVYKVLKTECAVSRGKFKLLNAIVNAELPFTKKSLEIMDLCLHCQACSEFCPSGIDAQKIVETANADMFKQNLFNWKKILLAQVFKYRFCLKTLKFFIEITRSLKLVELASIIPSHKIELLKSFLKINVKPLAKSSNTEKNITAVYFKGCINNYVNPSVNNAVYQIFDKTPVKIIEANFECCGLPIKSAGDYAGFEKILKKNLASLPKDFDYLIFDCESCKSTFLSYADFLDGDEKGKALNLKEKCISIYELLNRIDYTPKKQWKYSIVTAHYPCHTRFSNDKEYIKILINKIENIEFREAENADSCCGGAGSFIFTNQKLSQKISKDKAEGILKTEAHNILTACPSCVLGLKQGLLLKNSKINVMQLIEFLAK